MEPGKSAELAFEGVVLSLGEWSRRVGVSPSTLKSRLRMGMAVEEALCRPPGANRRTPDEALFALRLTGEVDGVRYEGKLSRYMPDLREALRAWRERRPVAESWGCKLELVRVDRGRGSVVVLGPRVYADGETERQHLACRLRNGSFALGGTRSPGI